MSESGVPPIDHALALACAAQLRDGALVAYARLSRDGLVLEANNALAGRLGMTAESLVGQSLADLVATDEAPTLLTRVAAEEPVETRFLVNFVDREWRPFTFNCRLWPDGDQRLLLGEPTEAWDRQLGERALELNNAMTVLSRDLARAKRAANAALTHLRDQHWHIRKLSEVLPICMLCGHIRVEEGLWQSLPDYLREHTDFLSHSFCPECASEAARSFEGGGKR